MKPTTTQPSLIEQTRQAKTAIKNIFDTERTQVEKTEKEGWELSRKLRDKIHEIESQKYQLESDYKKKVEAIKLQSKEDAAQFREVCAKHERVIELMKISKQDMVDLNLKVNNRGKEIIELANPVNNEYINLYVYIYENRKPKNRFTLAIAAKSIFTTELLGYRWGSIDPYFEGNNSTFEFAVKDAATKQELIDLYNKKGIDSLWNKDIYEALVKEYEAVLTDCNTPEWQKEYLLSQKYYYEHNYSNGTETPEYKAILKQLRKFETIPA